MITGANLQKCLLGVYFVIMLVYIHERNYPKALYWFAAGLITLSVLLMKRFDKPKIVSTMGNMNLWGSEIILET
jgi:drug/metabolite transporter (DMT)-like permease